MIVAPRNRRFTVVSEPQLAKQAMLWATDDRLTPDDQLFLSIG